MSVGGWNVMYIRLDLYLDVCLVVPLYLSTHLTTLSTSGGIQMPTDGGSVGLLSDLCRHRHPTLPTMQYVSTFVVGLYYIKHRTAYCKYMFRTSKDACSQLV